MIAHALFSILFVIFASAGPAACDDSSPYDGHDASGRQQPGKTRSIGQLSVPSALWLGEFDIDLGIELEGDRALVQTNYVMMRVLTAAASKKIKRTTNRKCNIVLTASSYPFIGAFA